MSLVAMLRTKVHRSPTVTVAGPEDQDLVAFVNEARTDGERRAAVGLAALRARGRR